MIHGFQNAMCGVHLYLAHFTHFIFLRAFCFGDTFTLTGKWKLVRVDRNVVAGKHRGIFEESQLKAARFVAECGGSPSSSATTLNTQLEWQGF